MMKIRARLLSLVALLLPVFGIGLSHFKTDAQQNINPASQVGDPILEEIAKYRQWARVNEQPLLVFNPGSSIAI